MLTGMKLIREAVLGEAQWGAFLCNSFFFLLFFGLCNILGRSWLQPGAKGKRGARKYLLKHSLLLAFLLVLALPEPSESYSPCPQGICQRERASGEPESVHETAAPAAD